MVPDFAKAEKDEVQDRKYMESVTGKNPDSLSLQSDHLLGRLK